MPSERLSFLLPAFESGFRRSYNGGPPVIWIISPYLWYQVHFLIIIVEFLVTVLSITYLRTIFWAWTVPLYTAVLFHSALWMSESGFYTVLWNVYEADAAGTKLVLYFLHCECVLLLPDMQHSSALAGLSERGIYFITMYCYSAVEKLYGLGLKSCNSHHLYT